MSREWSDYEDVCENCLEFTGCRLTEDEVSLCEFCWKSCFDETPVPDSPVEH